MRCCEYDPECLYQKAFNTGNSLVSYSVCHQISHFHPILIFVSKAVTYLSETFMGLHFKGRLFALLPNIILGWKGLKVTNTLAYRGPKLITIVKSFIVKTRERKRILKMQF
jgi:hypothetical protein